MLENKIIFQTTEPFFSDKSIRPEPAKIFIPDWYKNLQSYQGETSAITLKMCMPFLDAISMGYIIKMPHEYEINHMQYNPHVKDAPKETWVRSIRTSDHFGISSSKETHSIEQLGGEKGECPFIKQNSYQPIIKLLNPWVIKLPKGYSALFLPPINNENQNFFPISGVVDCDVFETPVNFPIVIKKQKTFLIKKGEPIATVIPFKREGWKSEFERIEPEDINKSMWKLISRLDKAYKTLFRVKKRWI